MKFPYTFVLLSSCVMISSAMAMDPKKPEVIELGGLAAKAQTQTEPKTSTPILSDIPIVQGPMRDQGGVARPVRIIEVTYSDIIRQQMERNRQPLTKEQEERRYIANIKHLFKIVMTKEGHANDSDSD